MKLFIGIDDTDNLETRGTGFRSRELCALINASGFGKVIGITRHQLFVNSAIPYTSHNSSACLEIVDGERDNLIEMSRNYLIENGAPGSDVGLCVAFFEQVNEIIVDWGIRAKKEVLTMNDAYNLAKETGIHLEGLTGLHTGIIGSMAGVGLRKAGTDGRYIWLPGKDFREIKGILDKKELMLQSFAREILDISTMSAIENVSLIDTGEWTRPVIWENEAVILVEKVDNQSFQYKVPEKAKIKSFSD